MPHCVICSVNNTRGILLVGGNGSRLFPRTATVSKQLLPVYDKPMVYYPFNTLMLAGIRDVLVIATPKDLPLFRQLLGDGSPLGMSLSYASQAQPNGIAQALIIADDTWGASRTALILGDNLFHGEGNLFRHVAQEASTATIFGYTVHNPSRYGVVELDSDNSIISIEEKPTNPRSALAIPGLYFYDERAASFARELRPSTRGELEITDVHRAYFDVNQLQVVRMDRGITWLDTGTPDSLLEAINFIHAIERRQGMKVACIEETALALGYITADEYDRTVHLLPDSAYRNYCLSVLER